MFSLEERPGNRGRSEGGRHRIRTMLESEIKDPIGSQQKARNKLQERIEGVMAKSFKFYLVPVLGNNTHVSYAPTCPPKHIRKRSSTPFEISSFSSVIFSNSAVSSVTLAFRAKIILSLSAS